MIARSAVSEKRFQSQVIDPARLSGWRTYHAFDSRRSAAGFPGPVMVMPVVIFAERKTEGGRGRPEQRGWLEVPERCLGVEVRLRWPRDWPEIEETLTRPADTMSTRTFGPPDVPSDLLCPWGQARVEARPALAFFHGWSGSPMGGRWCATGEAVAAVSRGYLGHAGTWYGSFAIEMPSGGPADGGHRPKRPSAAAAGGRLRPKVTGASRAGFRTGTTPAAAGPSTRSGS